MTFGERFDQCKGVGPSFDHLRVGLSLAILFWHSFGLAYGLEWTRSLSIWPFKPFLAALLPMFFALSGVLVIGSAIRLNNLRTFITFRVLRILPALFTEVSLSALIFGPLLTAVPLVTYFSSSEFFEYFGSFVGRVRYVLPGLFLTNPAPRVVNGALWTVGPEILCYLILSLLILTRAYRKPLVMLALTVAYSALCVVFDPFERGLVTEIIPTRALILAFLTGNLIFLFREKIPFSRPLAALVFGFSIVAISVTQSASGYLFLIYPAAAGLSYVVAVVGFSSLPPLPFFHRGDYSYGIYIYGYPIQQAIVYFLPGYRNGLIVFALALPFTMFCAIASWHFIEKPVLGLRKKLLPQKSAGPAVTRPMEWGWRRIAAAAGLSAYAIFVADSSNVFPIRQAAHLMLGKASPPKDSLHPQF